jgi:chemotaxis protein MotB
MAGHGGGAWKVAYADFVTAMMAFFLVMWITSQGEDVKKAVAGYFQDPWGTSSANTAPSFRAAGELSGENAGISTVPGRVRNRWTQSPPPDSSKTSEPPPIWAQQLDIHYLSNTDRTLPALIVPFDEGSAELSDQAKEQIATLIPALVGKLNMIEVRAHSTRRPLSSHGGVDEHWQLCYLRSLATMHFLMQQDIEPERIRLSESAGNEPLTTRYETTLQKENNRVELFLLDTVAADLPGTEPASSGDAKDAKSKADRPKTE